VSDKAARFVSGTLWVGKQGYEIDFEPKALVDGRYIDIGSRKYHVLKVGYYLSRTSIIGPERISHGPHVIAEPCDSLYGNPLADPGDVK
jgi:hypothetical protein